MTSTAGGLRQRRSVVVSSLGITQTLAWASTYYLTAVFADPIATNLHLSRTWFYGAVSAALLLSGLLGPAAGRMIDRYGGRDVLAWASGFMRRRSRRSRASMESRSDGQGDRASMIRQSAMVPRRH